MSVAAANHEPAATKRLGKLASVALILAMTVVPVYAQDVSQRGFLEGRGLWFPQTAPNDPVTMVGDALLREEAFWRPAHWFELAGGIDARANSHDEVEDQWRFDWADRGVQRPRVALRRLSATLSGGGFSVTVGKQFIRWGRADILNPTDRFAPRDYLNVIDTELLPVFAVRPSLQIGSETFEVVWSPYFTPARLPLVDQRWAVLPAQAAGLAFVDSGSIFPTGSEEGVRWSHTGSRIEGALSVFNGFNYLPDVDVHPLTASAVELVRRYPTLRTYGGDVAIPTRWVTVKGEAAYFQSAVGTSQDYTLYVVELERQQGEWVFDGGYVGEVGARATSMFPFAPDEGVARSVLARAAYTAGPARTITVEGAARQSGDGVYLKGEFSQGVGAHLRVTVTGVGLGGQPTDFLGQYHRNSHVAVALRFSF